MNELTNVHQGSTSFDDRIEILTQEIGLAINWQQPAVIMVCYGSVYIRDDSVSMLENFLMDHDQKVVWIDAADSVVNSLVFWEKILDDAENVVFFLNGFADLAYQRGFIGILNHHAYLFAEKGARLVFWLTFKEASALAYHAPTLWSGRQCLLELAVSPKPEQILQTALESAWQGTGEYSDQFEDTEAKISLRESFLTELPKNNETTSIRANLLLTLGILQWRKGDYEKANEMLDDALKMAAKLQDNWFEAKCFNAVALVKSSLGKNEDAIDSYKQAIRLAPEQIFVWNNLGNLCLKIDRNHEAMIAFQKAIEHNPTDPIAWNGMGDVYSHSEYVDDAIAAYRKSIELAPLLPHPWNGLGEIYARNGRIDDSVMAFQKAITLNNHFIQPWLGLARLYARHERYRDASKAYQRALMLDPKNSALWNDLGCIYIEAKRYDDAIEAIAKSIELDRGFGWAYSNLGLAHANCEKTRESISLYLKSLELLRDQEQRSITWNRLANSYRITGDYENAIKAYQKADSLNLGIALIKDSASTDPQPASEADSVPESEAGSTQEQIIESSTKEEAVEFELDPEEETPDWIFQSPGHQEDVTAHLFQASPHLFGSELGSSTAQPATTIQEIGGTSMQMTLPFIASKRVTRTKIRPIADLKTNPQAEEGNAKVWNEKGNQSLRAGDYEDAIRAYNKAIKCDRSFGWSYTNLGIAYLQLGKYAEAVLLLQKSLELLATDKERAVAWNELGNLYRCLNDYHNAVVSYQKSDELDPNQEGARDTVEYLYAEPTIGNAQVWNELGDTFFKSGSYAEASNCYRKVTEMVPLNGWAFSNLALSLTFQSKFEEAVPVYLKSIDLFKDDKEKADAWNRLGNVYRRLNDYDNAVAAYKQAVKLNKATATLLTRTRFSLLGNCSVD